jgi:hypothetical protein
MNMIGEHAQLIELRTRDEIKSSPDGGVIEGSDLPFDTDEDS